MYTAKQIAESLDGDLCGDEEIKIYRPAKIEEAQNGDISFVANGKYEAYAFNSKASVLLVNHDFDEENSNGKTIIRVDNVYEVLPKLLQKFEQKSNHQCKVSSVASIDPTVSIGKDVSIGAFTVIESGAIIEDGAIIYSNCFIGNGVKIGMNTTIYSGVRIYKACQIGKHSMIHSNAVIGSDGFGFSKDKENRFQKIPQLGNVIIGDHVEIGSNTVIDRGTMGSTLIGNGVKLDNLIQIAHNVEIGEDTVIAAQTGIAGSTKIGKNCVIGGQVGIVGHLKIADGTQIQAQSGVASNINEPSKKWYGYPAMPYFNYLRSFSVFKILPNLLKRIEKLEEKTAKKLNE